MKRRHIGAAYERSPFEKFSEWANRNALALVSAVFAFFAWVVVVVIGTGVMNFVAGDGSDDAIPPYDHDSTIGVIIKVVGGLIVSGIVTAVKSK